MNCYIINNESIAINSSIMELQIKIYSSVFYYPRDIREVKFPLGNSFENLLEKRRFGLHVRMKKLFDC